MGDQLPDVKVAEGTPNYGPAKEVRRPCARQPLRGSRCRARALPTCSAHALYPRPRQVSVRSLFAGKRGILFAVPGAFTPGCSKARARAAAAAAPRAASPATP